MPSVDVVDLENKKVGTVELPQEVFGCEPRAALVHEAVIMQRACERQGTASTLRRGEVAGSGKKPWKQKHTGRARAGSLRSPVWRHGGNVFGPKPRLYAYSMPKRKYRAALQSALSAKVNENQLIVLSELSLQEPKTNDPFANLPKSSFNLDEFKRTYSNKELSVSLPYLWQNFDKENYSFWFCEYKYADELSQIFMSSNLIGGMYQRLEKLRKNSFASMCVWGENGNNTIAGVWFWRGQELVFPLCPDWTTDYESFSWRKLSVDSEDDRKFINQVFSWEGDLNGKNYADGKIFK